MSLDICRPTHCCRCGEELETTGMECLCGSICCHGCADLPMHEEPHCPECVAKWPDDFSPEEVD